MTNFKVNSTKFFCQLKKTERQKFSTKNSRPMFHGNKKNISLNLSFVWFWWIFHFYFSINPKPKKYRRNAKWIAQRFAQGKALIIRKFFIHWAGTRFDEETSIHFIIYAAVSICFSYRRSLISMLEISFDENLTRQSKFSVWTKRSFCVIREKQKDSLLRLCRWVLLPRLTFVWPYKQETSAFSPWK